MWPRDFLYSLEGHMRSTGRAFGTYGLSHGKAFEVYKKRKYFSTQSSPIFYGFMEGYRALAFVLLHEQHADEAECGELEWYWQCKTELLV